MNEDLTISAYHVNDQGLLGYTGMPTSHLDIKPENHNGVIYMGERNRRMYSKFYPVYGVNVHMLLHGSQY